MKTKTSLNKNIIKAKPIKQKTHVKFSFCRLYLFFTFFFFRGTTTNRQIACHFQVFQLQGETDNGAPLFKWGARGNTLEEDTITSGHLPTFGTVYLWYGYNMDGYLWLIYAHKNPCMVYLLTWMVDFYGFHVGKYTIHGWYGI